MLSGSRNWHRNVLATYRNKLRQGGGIVGVRDRHLKIFFKCGILTFISGQMLDPEADSRTSYSQKSR